jgi:hypothetical protein
MGASRLACLLRCLAEQRIPELSLIRSLTRIICSANTPLRREKQWGRLHLISVFVAAVDESVSGMHGALFVTPVAAEYLQR